MITNKTFIPESDSRLHRESDDVKFPLSKDDIDLIDKMMEYLINSQDDDLSKKYDLRPGMGISAVQIGVPKKISLIAIEDEHKPKKFRKYIFLNPKIISHSNEKIFVDEGEGCLSVNRPTDGIVPRYARVTIEYQDMDGNTKIIRLRELDAIVVQHEIDHNNGILFIDHIDPKKPYKYYDHYRSIQ